ncbi:bifunctional phosphopantothenoylcysteine decarboxylase/phosphopantothenate--cysteine ligase CoaBC [Fodinisporobacter ferrooxydans]|uniref:Coenzyme A biosynthesis bifunctional protein CoaBC n=1 Tax=Fodinisporobacter ferrooxydans TaxID=2901836 RepID=A0ABY4CIC1_9BACL|nr:bifunctional phosphopantothenoylcysteine decarboxylase/phosphopantothenate--cysteine ligase CoaBC [Alicyclobacillaceae bacterium MYW30-H2]
MQGKTVVLGVCGGIAAYKAAEICSSLMKKGADVHVIMTKAATQFITPLTFQALSHHAVITDMFHEPDPSAIAHIRLADAADVFLVAPATADVIGKVANGIGDDMLTTTLMATTAQVVFSPAMNVHMYANPIVQDQIQYLKSKGYLFLEPGEGPLACGYTGRGRLPEPREIVSYVQELLQKRRDFAGLCCLVTAGATRETIDPVRFLSNRSSGKMGMAIAEELRDRGGQVTLILGPTHLEPPCGLEIVRVESAQDMYHAVMEREANADMIVKTAAVADYRPVATSEHKVKKQAGNLMLELERTPDILQELGMRKRPGQLLVGFAAETQDLDRYALDKLHRKHLDLVVANDVSKADAGFAVDTNAVRIYDASGLLAATPLLSKREVARTIVNHMCDRWRRNQDESEA